jgi:hypothetical protein
MSLAYARIIEDAMVPSVPASMKGFLLPHDILHWSLLMPTYGCTSTPVNGPASHTNASRALLMPRESRYGDPLESSTDQTICRPPIHTVRRMRYKELLFSTLSEPSRSMASEDVWPK